MAIRYYEICDKCGAEEDTLTCDGCLDDLCRDCFGAPRFDREEARCKNCVGDLLPFPSQPLLRS
jgi:hypothetical protein